MKLLSLDCSTARCSLAFMHGEDVAYELFWETASTAGANGKARHENVIDLIEKARAETGWRWDDIESFVAGRGPGNYSGLRAALLTVQAIAAPARTPVHAVSSMEALALDLMEQQDLPAIAIIGDARRQSCWIGACEREKITSVPATWETLAHETVKAKLTQTRFIATPNWQETSWLHAEKSGSEWIPESQFPTAAQVARLALRRKAQKSPPDPLVPIYAHPAV